MRQTIEGNAGSERGFDPLNLDTKVEDAARGAHEATDKLAQTAAAQIDRGRATAHRAVDSAAATAASAAEAASKMVRRANEAGSELVASTNAFIRERPITAVVTALVAGYLLGRLIRR